MLFVISGILACFTATKDSAYEEEAESNSETLSEDSAISESIEDTAAEEEPTPEAEHPFSQIDPLDPLACQNYSERTQLEPVLFPISDADAAQILVNPAKINPQGETVGEQYLVDFSSTEGWFIMQIPSWMCVVSLYTDRPAEIELFPAEDVVFIGESPFDTISEQKEIADCDDTLLRNSWQFHAWGSYLVRLRPEDTNGPFWLSTYLQE